MSSGIEKTPGHSVASTFYKGDESTKLSKCRSAFKKAERDLERFDEKMAVKSEVIITARQVVQSKDSCISKVKELQKELAQIGDRASPKRARVEKDLKEAFVKKDFACTRAEFTSSSRIAINALDELIRHIDDSAEAPMSAGLKRDRPACAEGGSSFEELSRRAIDASVRVRATLMSTVRSVSKRSSGSDLSSDEDRTRSGESSYSASLATRPPESRIDTIKLELSKQNKLVEQVKQSEALLYKIDSKARVLHAAYEEAKARLRELEK